MNISFLVKNITWKEERMFFEDMEGYIWVRGNNHHSELCFPAKES